MNRVAGMLILASLLLLGCEAQAPEEAGEGETLAAAGLSGAAISSTGAGEQELPEMVVRRVWGDDDVDLFGQVSYDGRFLSFVDWGTGDLAVRDLSTGEKRRLTDKGTWTESQQSAEGSVVSPDGRQVAYTWMTEDGSAELRVVRTDGSGERTLVRDEFVEYVHPEDWSRDGRQILTQIYRPERTNQIVLVSAGGGAIQVVKTWTGGSQSTVGSARISPDGQWIAYDLPVQTEEGRNRDIFLSSSDGTTERLLIQHPAEDRVLGWTPDGQQLLFASDRSGTLGVWLMEVRDGASRGEARLVKPDLWRIEPMGLTDEGSFYYGVNTITRHVYVATVDVATGEVLAGPVAVSQGLEGANTPRWSPNGHALAFRAQKMGNGGNLIALWSPDTGETAELEPRVGRFGRPLWTGDGRYLLMPGRDDSGRGGLFTVDTQSGLSEPLENFWGVNFASPFNVSQDGTRLFTTVWLPDGGKALQARPLEGGQVTTLFSGAPQGAALSPDGGRVAFVDFREGAVTVNVVPAGGGSVIELFSADEPGEDYPGTVGWSPDGSHIVFATHPPEASQTAEVVFLPVDGGNAETRLTLEFATTVQGVRNLQFSPDGRRIAFDAGSGNSEVWVMENFLPGH